MNLEPVIQSEVSQKRKTNINTYVYMEPSNVVLMNLFVEQEWTCRLQEQICGHRRGRRVWDRSD